MPKTSVKEQFSQAAGWIKNSGIQSSEGGFYSWFDNDNKSYSYLYSEITGYGITTLLFLYDIEKDAVCLDKAQAAAAWLKKIAMHPCCGMRTRFYSNDTLADKTYSFAQENIFSFDTGMVLYGIANLYRVTAVPEYIAMATKIADFLIGVMQQDDGSLAPIYNPKRKELSLPLENKWSNQPAGFHAKVALGFADLFDITADKKYYDAALRLCEYAISTQEASGRFITDKKTNTTHLHPHCYSAEGLWYVGSRFNIPEFVLAARNATIWALEHVNSSGINELYSPEKGFNAFVRSDILAQLLRLSLIFSKNSGQKELLSALLSHQLRDASSQSGGFLFNKNCGHINSWCSMFALQALYLHENKKSTFFEQPRLLI
ncbi:MAG: hypothetical protein PHQ96_00270 [Candidatus Omnitrophica bacterium]|nr:hypothetical protein [Candidatus Omnitrophota bacterium]